MTKAPTPASVEPVAQVLKDRLEVLLTHIGARALWDADVRAIFEKHKIIVVPSGFYYPVPNSQELADSFEKKIPAPYLSPAVFDQTRIANVIHELSRFSAEFDPPATGDLKAPSGFAWDMRMYSNADAMSYYGMLRWKKPRRVVEIGSGYSTLIARQALAKNGAGKITCVEPFPRDFIKAMPDIELVAVKAQEIDIEWLNATLSDGDVLFIDSTHAVKAGSDCLHIYLRLLPAITHNITVHVHDIALPKGTHQGWIDARIFWTEQYLLYAYLLDNPYTRVLFGSAYGMLFAREALERMMHGRAPASGQSFWFELAGADRSRNIASSASLSR